MPQNQLKRVVDLCGYVFLVKPNIDMNLNMVMYVGGEDGMGHFLGLCTSA